MSKTKNQEKTITIIYSLYTYIIFSYWNISQKSGTKNGLKKAESVYRVIAFLQLYQAQSRAIIAPVESLGELTVCAINFGSSDTFYLCIFFLYFTILPPWISLTTNSNMSSWSMNALICSFFFFRFLSQLVSVI